MSSPSVALTEAELEDHDPHAPRLWQVWRPFIGIHRWYFARGCPPTLQGLTGLTACVHASVLLGAMGFVAAVAGLAVTIMVLLSDTIFVEWEGALIGLVYGVVVILPLSRWCGSKPWETGKDLIASVACFGLIDHFGNRYIGYLFSASNGPNLLASTRLSEIFGTASLLLSCVVVSANRRIGRSLILTSAGVFCAFLNEATIAWAANHGFLEFCRTSEALNCIVFVQPILLCLIGLSIALGSRLWPWMGVNAAQKSSNASVE